MEPPFCLPPDPAYRAMHAMHRRILVDNAAELYGFTPPGRR